MQLFLPYPPIKDGNRQAGSHKNWLLYQTDRVNRLARLVKHCCGWTNGVLNHQADFPNGMKVLASATPDMKINVQPGVALCGDDEWVFLDAVKGMGPLMRPTSHPRIDLVFCPGEARPPTYRKGIEAVSPAEPTLNSWETPLALIYLRPTMTAIVQNDDGTNGYIIDRRLLLGVNTIHARLQWFLAQAWGGGDGVIRAGADATASLRVHATTTPSMAIVIEPGGGFASSRVFRAEAAVTISSIPAPASNPRIDIVQAATANQMITLKAGTESASPTAPAVDSGCIKLAEIYCRVGMTSIKDASDGTNGYVTDKRTFL